MAGRFQRVVLALSLPAIITIVSIYWLRRRKKALAEAALSRISSTTTGDLFAATTKPKEVIGDTVVAVDQEMQLKESNESVPAKRGNTTSDQKESATANAAIVVQVLNEPLKAKMTLNGGEEEDDKPDLVKVGLKEDDSQEEVEDEVGHEETADNICINQSSDDQSFHSNHQPISTEVDAQKVTCDSSDNGQDTLATRPTDISCLNSPMPVGATELQLTPKSTGSGVKSSSCDVAVATKSDTKSETEARGSPASIGFYEASPGSQKTVSASPSSLDTVDNVDKVDWVEIPSNSAFSDIHSEVSVI